MNMEDKCVCEVTGAYLDTAQSVCSPCDSNCNKCEAVNWINGTKQVSCLECATGLTLQSYTTGDPQVTRTICCPTGEIANSDGNCVTPPTTCGS